MKKVVKIVLVAKGGEPKQLQQKLLPEMQRSTMSYGMVRWHAEGSRLSSGPGFSVFLLFKTDVELQIALGIIKI